MSGPAFPVCRLWEKVSGKGNKYLVGRLGGARILVMENTRPADGDTSTHILMFAEAPARAATASQATPAEQRKPRPRQAPRGGSIDDDPVPF